MQDRISLMAMEEQGLDSVVDTLYDKYGYDKNDAAELVDHMLRFYSACKDTRFSIGCAFGKGSVLRAIAEGFFYPNLRHLQFQINYSPIEAGANLSCTGIGAVLDWLDENMLLTFVSDSGTVFTYVDTAVSKDKCYVVVSIDVKEWHLYTELLYSMARICGLYVSKQQCDDFIRTNRYASLTEPEYRRQLASYIDALEGFVR